MKRLLILPLLVFGVFAQEPEHELRFADPVLVEHGGVTSVTIPGELLLLEEEGRPMVPYARRVDTFPKGYRVVDMKLSRVAEPESILDITLPVVQIDAYLDNPPPMTPGYFPKEQFRWELFDNADGSTVLVTLIFPFHYTPEKRLGVFHSSYEFELTSVETGVSITGIGTERPTFDPGDAVAVALGLENTGGAQAVTVEAGVYEPGSDRRVERLGAKKLTLDGAETIALTWNTGKGTAGDFEMRVSVKDASGRELDRDVAWFRVGRPAAELTGFEAAPDPFKPGEKVVARFRVENTGTCAISGEGVLAVSRGGSLVEEIRENFTGLKPGKDRAFELAWDTEGAERDAVYGLAGLARFEGGATEAQRTEASTNARPVASFTASAESVAVNEEVEFDASGTTDPDGRVAQLEWEFGDGGTAAGPKVRHGYSEPDSYRVRLLATDDKGRPAAAELVVVVTGD